MVFDFTFNIDELNSFSNEQKAIDYKFATSKNSGVIKAYKSIKSGKSEYRIIKKSIDARRKPKVNLTYKVEVDTPANFVSRDKKLLSETFIYQDKKIDINSRPVIVGFGPAGIFAALTLSRYGLKPVIIERGSKMDKRISDVEAYSNGLKDVNLESNIQFGEGGAGTFSDGKLYSGVSSQYKQFVFDTFVTYGAPKDISYDSHPHIGTDNLRVVISRISDEIIRLGG